MLGNMNLKKIMKINNTEFTRKLKPIYVAIEKVKKEINGKSLIGFVGAPWTLLLYMFNLESPKRNFNFDKIKKRKGWSSINAVKTNSLFEIKSPIIGTAYLAPEPGAKKFVETGKKIKKGDTVMIVEAMKTMNHVPSPKDGVVKSVNVEDGQPVEYGQTLVVID